jgi:hypothetical protein
MAGDCDSLSMFDDVKRNNYDRVVNLFPRTSSRYTCILNSFSTPGMKNCTLSVLCRNPRT